MIRFSLSCKRDHKFEGWFAGNEDYEKQKNAGLIACPVCGSAQIGKMLMTPNIAAKSAGENSGESRAESKTATAGDNVAPGKTGAPSPAGSRQVLETLLRLRQMQKRKLEVLHKLQDLARKMRESAENVGEQFAEEARKIHYGEAEKRVIYGKADREQVHSLTEEGIDILPLPRLPEDNN